MTIRGMAVVLLVSTVPTALHAQSDDLGKALRTAKVLKCEFTLLASGTWTKAGDPQAETKPMKLTLGFESIDTDEGTATVTGQPGAPYIIARSANLYLHFLQIGSDGNLYATTVFDKVARPGRLKAVHTRHEYTDVSLPGYTSRPEQYYGDCEVVK